MRLKMFGSKYFLLLYFFFLLCITSKAQQHAPYTLVELINTIEKRDKVDFSYNVQILKGITIKLNSKDITIDDFIKILEKNTTLGVKQLGDNYLLCEKKENQKFLKTDFCFIFKDAITKENIPNVVVQLSNLSFLNSKKNGQVNFKASNNDTIRVFKEEYRYMKIPLADISKDCKVQFLEESIQALHEVVLVRNYLNSAVSKNKDGTFDINYESDAIFPGLVINDVTESLQLLPGIYSPTESAADLNIRGGSNDQNLYIWDGIKFYQSGHFFDQFSLFNPFIIENIKLIKNAPNPIYQDVGSGILDITTDTKIPKKIGVKTGVSFTGANASLKIPIAKKLSILGAARTSVNFFDINNELIKDKVLQNTNLSETLINNSNVDAIDQNFSYQDLNLKIRYEPSEKTALQLSGFTNLDRFNCKNTLIVDVNDDSQIGTTPPTIRENTDSFETINRGTSFRWDQQLSSKLSSRMLIYNSEHFFSFNASLLESIQNNQSEENSPVSIASKNEIEDNQVSLSFDYKISDLKSIRIGVDYNITDLFYSEKNPRNELLGSRNVTIDNKINTATLFGGFKLQNSKWNFDAGLRVNYYRELDKLITTPRVSVSRKINKALRLFSSFELKSQLVRKSYLTSDTRFSTFREAWIIADNSNSTSIPLFTGIQGALGATYSKKNLVIDIDFFAKSEDGLTFFDENTPNAGATPIFIGSGITYGLDSYIKFRIKKWKTWLNYSYLNNTVSFSDVDTPIVTLSNQIPHYVNWSNVLSWKEFDFGVSYIIRSGLPYSFPSAGLTSAGEPILTYEAINNQRLPTYQRTDFSISHTIKNSKRPNFKVTYGLQIKNIFAQQNIIKRNFSLTRLLETDNAIEPDNNTEVFQYDDVSRRISTELFIQLRF